MSDRPSLTSLGVDEVSLPGSSRTLQADIYGLTDYELARGITKLIARPVASVPLDAWERQFCEGAAKAWARYHDFTWKQRREARRVLLRVLVIVVRGGLVRQWLDEENGPGDGQ